MIRTKTRTGRERKRRIRREETDAKRKIYRKTKDTLILLLHENKQYKT